MQRARVLRKHKDEAGLSIGADHGKKGSLLEMCHQVHILGHTPLELEDSELHQKLVAAVNASLDLRALHGQTSSGVRSCPWIMHPPEHCYKLNGIVHGCPW